MKAIIVGSRTIVNKSILVEYVDCLIDIWDGKSRGTKNATVEMKKLNKPLYAKEKL